VIPKLYHLAFAKSLPTTFFLWGGENEMFCLLINSRQVYHFGWFEDIVVQSLPNACQVHQVGDEFVQFMCSCY
jgi:hypothetical protein